MSPKTTKKELKNIKTINYFQIIYKKHIETLKITIKMKNFGWIKFSLIKLKKIIIIHFFIDFESTNKADHILEMEDLGLFLIIVWCFLFVKLD